MKGLVYALLLIISVQILNAQSPNSLTPVVHAWYDENGNPSHLKILINDSVFRYTLDGINSDDPVELMAGDRKLILQIPSRDQQSFKKHTQSTLQRFEPGESPEGDMVHDIAFTPDGRLFGVLYQHSSNIYFYDSAFQLLEIVDVGDGPMDLEFTNSKAYVCCSGSDQAFVINLASFSITRVFNIPENSCQIEVAPDESKVYIGCYSWMNGGICAYDLGTLQQLFYNTQPYIHHYGYYGNQGRCFYEYARFYLSPSGDEIISAYTGSNRPAVFDAETGALIKIFDFESFRGAGFSVTADTLFILSANMEELILHRVNSFSHSVIDSIRVFQQDVLDYSDLAISSDGQKVMTVDTWTEAIFHFDFDTHSCNQIGESLFSNAWLRVNADRTIAALRIFGDVHFYGLENGNYLGEFYSVTEQAPGLAAAVSPVDGKLVCGNDNLLFGMVSGESIVGVDFDDQVNVTSRLVADCGQPLEADITRSAVIANNGSRLVAANYLTGNISFINYWTGHVDTLMPFEKVQHVVAIPGSDLVICYGYENQEVWFVNSATLTIEEVINMNHVDQCVVDPTGEYAYLYTHAPYQSAGMLYKVLLQGQIAIADQFQVNLTTCGLIILGDFPEVQLKLSVSPNGKMMLFPDDDPLLGSVIRVVDLDLMNEMAVIPVANFCTYDYAFSEDSKYALIGSDDDDLPLIYLNGSTSFLIKYVKITGRTYSIAYNNTDDQFYILQNKNAIVKVNPVSGTGTGTIPTNEEYGFQIGIENGGKPVVRQTSGIWYDGMAYDLPGISRGFSFDDHRNLFIIPTPGPDAVSVFNELHVGEEMLPNQGPDWTIYPNPATNYLVLDTGESMLNKGYSIRLVSVTGETVFTADVKESPCRIFLENIPTGIYALMLMDGEKHMGSHKISILK